MGGDRRAKRDPGRFQDLMSRKGRIRSSRPPAWLILAVAVLAGLLFGPAMAIPPVADFTVNPSSGMGRVPLTAYFTDTSTGSVGEWWWDFGDGSTSTSQNPVHQYQYTGTYVVTLTVFPLLPPGSDVTFLNPPEKARTITVYNPTITLSPSSGKAGTQVTVTGNSFNLYAIEFPQGTITFNGIVVVSNFWFTRTGSLGSFTTSFTVPSGTAPGSYTIRAAGPLDSAEALFTITNIAPQALIDADPFTGKTPLPVHFRGTRSYDEDGSISSYRWDFGDGTSATGTQVDHTYNRSGEYRTTLTVTDNQGKSGTAAITIRADNSHPVADARADRTSGSDPLTVNFDGSQSRDPDGRIVSYQWNFGDDYSEKTAIATHQYRDPQSYTAVLTVTDDKGMTDTDKIVITVGNEPPVAAIAVSPQQGTSPLTVQVDGSQSHDPDDTDLTFLWDFGDGFSGSGMTAGHTYEEEGTYQLSLLVTDPHAASNWAEAPVEVKPPFPWWYIVIGGIGIVAGTMVVLRRYVRPPMADEPPGTKVPEPAVHVDIKSGVKNRLEERARMANYLISRWMSGQGSGRREKRDESGDQEPGSGPKRDRSGCE